MRKVNNKRKLDDIIYSLEGLEITSSVNGILLSDFDRININTIEEEIPDYHQSKKEISNQQDKEMNNQQDKEMDNQQDKEMSISNPSEEDIDLILKALNKKFSQFFFLYERAWIYDQLKLMGSLMEQAKQENVIKFVLTMAEREVKNHQVNIEKNKKLFEQKKVIEKQRNQINEFKKQKTNPKEQNETPIQNRSNINSNTRGGNLTDIGFSQNENNNKDAPNPQKIPQKIPPFNPNQPQKYPPQKTSFVKEINPSNSPMKSSPPKYNVSRLKEVFGEKVNQNENNNAPQLKRVHKPENNTRANLMTKNKIDEKATKNNNTVIPKSSDSQRNKESPKKSSPGFFDGLEEESKKNEDTSVQDLDNLDSEDLEPLDDDKLKKSPTYEDINKNN